ncbi:uncharacterized protein [Ambystoma mexicanum]|uniref:uncharacterized protein n=1 Tax=Ambystoma mexicanum TaxID=8296 RepID=UPI0037E7AF65
MDAQGQRRGLEGQQKDDLEAFLAMARMAADKFDTSWMEQMASQMGAEVAGRSRRADSPLLFPPTPLEEAWVEVHSQVGEGQDIEEHIEEEELVCKRKKVMTTKAKDNQQQAEAARKREGVTPKERGRAQEVAATPAPLLAEVPRKIGGPSGAPVATLAVAAEGPTTLEMVKVVTTKGRRRSAWVVGYSLVSRAGASWTSKQEELTAREYRVQRHGVPGMKWPQLRGHMHKLLGKQRKPDVLVVHLGGNDLTSLGRENL